MAVDFNNPQQVASFRESMIDKGYEVDRVDKYLENKKPLETQDKGLSNPAKITQKFGNRSNVEVFSKGYNRGADLGVPAGTALYLPQGEWEVVEAFGGARNRGYIGNSTNRGYGNSIQVRNKNTGELLRFSHLNKVNAKPGQIISGGSVVGATGSTGNSTGPHLDIEYIDQRGRLRDVLASQYGRYYL